MIRQLLDAGADANVDGGEPLLTACRSGKTHIVEILIDAGAKIHIHQGVPGYALQKAAKWGHIPSADSGYSLGLAP